MPVSYEASALITGVDSARGLLALAGGGDGRICRIIRAYVTQVGDTTGQQLKCALQATSGTVTGAGAANGQKHEPLSSASPNWAATYNITSEPSYSGNPVGLEGDNSQAGYRYEPDRPRYRLSGSQKVVLRLLDAPSPPIDLAAVIEWEEEG